MLDAKLLKPQQPQHSFAGALIIVTFKKLAPGDEMLRIHPSPALILLS